MTKDVSFQSSGFLFINAEFIFYTIQIETIIPWFSQIWNIGYSFAFVDDKIATKA